MTRLRAAGVDVVLEVVEADLQDDRPYFVMPWCEETLEDAVTDVRHRLDPEAAVAVLIELVRSVAVPRLKLH